MNEHLRGISLDFTVWTHYKTVEPFEMSGVPIAGLRQDCYQTEIDGEIISAGVFEYKGKKTHVAWGVKSEPHCSFHALALPDGSWGAPTAGCPEYQVVKEGNIIAGFSVDDVSFQM